VPLLASSADVAIVSYLVDEDLLMTSLPLGIIGALFVTTTIGYARGLDLKRRALCGTRSDRRTSR